MGKFDGPVATDRRARGQGAAEGRLFADEGASVLVTDVLGAEGDKTAGVRRRQFVHHDVADPAEWEALVGASRRDPRPPRHPDQQRRHPAAGRMVDSSERRNEVIG